MKALQKNKIWDLVPLPKEKKIVGCKSVFSINHKADRFIERYKARLVAKGYTQTYDIYYQETFSPVAKLNIVRVLLSLVANLDWLLHQFDLKWDIYPNLISINIATSFIVHISILLIIDCF